MIVFQFRVFSLQLRDEDIRTTEFAIVNNGFNYRAMTLLSDSKHYPHLRDGSVRDTNDQVVVSDGMLWVCLYWCGNKAGFKPDALAAFATSLIDHTDVCRYIHLGCVLADLYMWNFHRYNSSLSEQQINIQPAIDRLVF